METDLKKALDMINTLTEDLTKGKTPTHHLKPVGDLMAQLRWDLRTSPYHEAVYWEVKVPVEIEIFDDVIHEIENNIWFDA